jgi:hypothetical protein
MVMLEETIHHPLMAKLRKGIRGKCYWECEWTVRGNAMFPCIPSSFSLLTTVLLGEILRRWIGHPALQNHSAPVSFFAGVS